MLEGVSRSLNGPILYDARPCFCAKVACLLGGID
jgi:hypothetical protein